MDATVKAAMLKSSQVLAANPSTAAPVPSTPRTVRKARSIESITSPHASFSATGPNDHSRRGGLWGSALAGKSTTDLHALDSSDKTHGRGTSLDAAQTLSRANAPVIPAELVSSKSKERVLGKGMSPVKFCSVLTSSSSTTLDIEAVKKLRLMLRNEAARWLCSFGDCYCSMFTLVPVGQRTSSAQAAIVRC